MNSLHHASGRLLPLVAACLIAALFVQHESTRIRAAAEDSLNLEQFWSAEYGLSSAPRLHTRSLANEYTRKRLAKARPDECFQGIGNPANLSGPLGFFPNYPGDLTDEQVRACGEIAVTEYATPHGHAQPKINQAYVWGLTKHGQDLWFGTIANTHCLVFSGFLQFTAPSLNSSWACEGSRSAIGDVRPPRAFVYDLRAGALSDMTAAIRDRSQADAARLSTTIGLRSAGSHRGVIFLGGISTRAVNIFAFDGITREYLGSISFDGQGDRPLYTNIRQWRIIKQELYVGVGTSDGGEILRWTGDATNPFQFERVGQIAGDPAYLTGHKGRVFVSSWPNFGGAAPGAHPMSIWMSPEIGESGYLSTADSTMWQSIWSISDYEPERSVALTTAGGALMSYKGDLYWGTMHVPGLSLLAWRALNPNATEDERRAAVLGTHRAISVFRASDIATPREKVELLYGNAMLPQHTADEGWSIVENNMQQVPKYGLAGFNNFFNNYTWWMEVFDGRLFVGTMDFLYLGAAEIRDRFDFPMLVTETFERFYGADLWAFSSRNTPAAPVSRSGVGNFTNYGIRTMVATRDALYLGTANPMNLLTAPNDDVPEGGWELIRLRSKDTGRHLGADDDES